MADEIKQTTEETEPQEQIQEQPIEEPKPEEKSENANWLKQRLERAKEQGAKQVLSELGDGTFQSVKEKLEAARNYEKQVAELQERISKAKIVDYKLKAMQKGIDDKFVDFVVHQLRGEVTEENSFDSLLEKYKTDNPQYLKNSQEKGIKFSTAPNFETKAQQPTNNYELMDRLIRKK